MACCRFHGQTHSVAHFAGSCSETLGPPGRIRTCDPRLRSKALIRQIIERYRLSALKRNQMSSVMTLRVGQHAPSFSRPHEGQGEGRVNTSETWYYRAYTKGTRISNFDNLPKLPKQRFVDMTLAILFGHRSKDPNNVRCPQIGIALIGNCALTPRQRRWIPAIA